MPSRRAKRRCSPPTVKTSRASRRLIPRSGFKPSETRQAALRLAARTCRRNLPMRVCKLSTVALTALAGGLPWLLGCAAAPRPAAPLPVGSSAPAAPTAAATASPAAADPHSFAHPWEVAVEHLALDLTVDFESRRLSGRASLRLRQPTAAGVLYLDTRDLDVRRVTLDDGKTEAPFTLGDPVPFLGRSLAIRIPAGTVWVHVDYRTQPEAAALQWLTPIQAGSQLPLLFTQSEPILARTWVPCQDTPAVRQTYEATVRVPPGMLALMSAENPTAKAADGIYHFRMPQPVPSYLLALAAGDLAWKPLSNRSGVYALPAVLERAAWELAETPRMIDAAEKLYGPYRWGRYDLLVLPPSYPYGGMENPRLTFATPTILAGDRSLVSLVAHELAHSWSGNLVTNATWSDFWLNEGFTVYLERRILEKVYGRARAEMEAVLGRRELDREMSGLPGHDRVLHIDLAGRDPDDGCTLVPYEKGALLLRTIEQSVGRERFDSFLHAYFDHFAFQSITTAQFLDYLRAHLDTHVPLGEWINQPGIPSGAAEPRSDAFDRIESPDRAGWSTHQWLHFLRTRQDPDMAQLDREFHFTETGNSEILSQWLQMAVQRNYQP